MPRRTSPRLLLAVVVGGVAVVVGLALLVSVDAVGSVEARVLAAVNGWPGWTTAPLVVVMQLGDVLAVGIVALAALAWRRRLALDVAVAGGLAFVVSSVVKELVGRPRPVALVDDVVLRVAELSSPGLPSGHATVATAMATVATPWLGVPARVVVWTLAVLVAVARVHVGVHLPWDVTAGVALGAALGALVLLVDERTRSGAAEDD